MAARSEIPKLIGDVLKQCLRDGISVNLDGLGSFQRRGSRAQFIPNSGPKVFIAYVIEDLPLALQIYDRLEAAGMHPWLDRKKLLPGQQWRRCVERAIDTADLFVACFSRAAAQKRGQFPYEVRYALKCSERMPLDDLFVMPVRLEQCAVPQRIMSQIQYVDLFPDADKGLARLVESIEAEWMARFGRRAA